MRYAIALVLLYSLSSTPVWAQSRPPAAATAHALDELANAIAQGKITLTPTLTPSPTPTPTPTAAVTATDVPVPSDTPVPTATPGPCWLTDETWGDPDNGYIVFVPLADVDGYSLVDSDGNPSYGPVAIPCDATPTPTSTPTDVPTDAPSPAATPTPRPTAIAARPPARPAAPAAAPSTPTTIPDTATPTPPATVTPTVEPSTTATASPTRTASPTATPRPTNVPIVIATPRPLQSASIEARSVSWTVFAAMLGLAIVVGAAAFAIYRWKRRHYLAQLQALESET